MCKHLTVSSVSHECCHIAQTRHLHITWSERRTRQNQIGKPGELHTHTHEQRAGSWAHVDVNMCGWKIWLGKRLKHTLRHDCIHATLAQSSIWFFFFHVVDISSIRTRWKILSVIVLYEQQQPHKHRQRHTSTHIHIPSFTRYLQENSNQETVLLFWYLEPP